MSLRDAFLQELGETGLEGAATDDDLERMLQALVEQAALVHPELEVSAVAMARAMGRTARGHDVRETLAKLHTADLALACACADANPRALTRFEREFGRDIERAVERVPDVGMDRDDFRQRVREKLFTATGGAQPRIATYGGRGSLRAWVRVTATRLALDLTRRRADPQHQASADGDLVERIDGGTDPELAFMRSQWGQELRTLMEVAIGRLSPRHRNLLRYHYLHGLTARKIAQMYDVHRATAFRWLEEARGAVIGGLSAAAQEQLRVGPEEIQSIVALLGSRLDLSMRRLIDSRLEAEDDPLPH